jgi:hypothetical protein
MSYELQDNSGTLFRNSKKQEGDKLPDYNGTIKVDGVEKQIAGWVRQGAKGTFLSLKISEPYKKPDVVNAKVIQPKREDSDGLPF